MANPNWVKGRSGNPAGNSKMRMLSDDLRKVLTQNPEKLRRITEKLVDEAMDGNLTATALIWDRLEGKAHQTIAIDQTVTQMTSDEVERRILELQSRLYGPRSSQVIDLQADEDRDGQGKAN